MFGVTPKNFGKTCSPGAAWQVNFMLVNLGSLDDSKKQPGEISVAFTSIRSCQFPSQ
jgi:hypothetical protein